MSTSEKPGEIKFLEYQKEIKRSINEGARRKIGLSLNLRNS